MLKAFLYIFLLVLGSCTLKEVNRKGTFGEGVVTIGYYFIPVADTAKMDTTNHLFMRMTYYIKGNKILRRDKESETELFATKDTTTAPDKTKITSHFEAKLVHPSYVINWDTKMMYTFFRQKGKILVSEDSLKNQTSDVFYPQLLNSERMATFLNGKDDLKIKIAGIWCKNGTGIINFKKNGITRTDTCLFHYAKRQLPIRSPLNNFLPDFKDDILSISLPTTSEDYSNYYGCSIFIIEKIKDTLLDDKLFIIPDSMEVRSKVPWQEMYDKRLE